MMNNNKILTVSYGTFSCTLEGFEDSFGTMKAIAEYFRDLAADDRYFGSEPPQPDAEMLARIAQKEVSRRVEAREHEGKIVLSAKDEAAEAPRALDAPVAAATAAAVIETPQPEVAEAAEEVSENIQEAEEVVTAELDETEAADESSAEDHAEEPAAALEEEVIAEVDAPQVEDVQAEAPAEEAEVAEEDVRFDEVAEDENAAQSQNDDEAEVIEETQEASDAVAEAEEEAEAAADAIAAHAEEADTQDAAEDVVTLEEVADHAEDENDIVPGQPDAEVEAFFANAETAEEVLEDNEPVAEDAVAEPAADSIAAKLQRIRAVVARHEEVEEDDDFAEDEHAENAAPDAEDVIASARTDLEAALEADEASDIEDVAEEDDLADILSRLDQAADEEPADAGDSLVAEITDTEAGDQDALDNLFEDDAQDDGIAGIAALVAEEAAVDAEATEPKPLQVTTSDDANLEVEEDVAAEEQPAPPRARVIKVKRADLEAAINRGELEEYEEDEAEASAPALDDLAPARVAETSLSAEDEAELARELAELEADMHTDEVEETAAESAEFVEENVADVVAEEQQEQPAPTDDTEAEVAEVKPGRAKLMDLADGSGEDVERLMAEAEQQMDEPESAVRRDAFAHLRAAVAAKKADEALGAHEDAEGNDDAYRNDLADVVRPRRPEAGAAQKPRPTDAGTAPLKLVAEQRIDVDEPAAPVQPRRVAAIDEVPAPRAEAANFAEFAADVGASKLPELLEAAASYMSFVEGREQFSRPQLMTKVRQAGPEGFSREDGLRSFGQLLRSGKIEKIKGGRFTVSDDIGYRPDQRAAS